MGKKRIPACVAWFVKRAASIGDIAGKLEHRGKRKMENKKSPTRTFFILHRETILEAPPRFELGIKVLQTFALPLGYSADWSGLRGSNSLPPPWQGGALPDELNPQWRSGWDSNPRPLPWQGSVLTNWTTRPIWWELQGSNLWPSACKADALPAELSSHSSPFQERLQKKNTWETNVSFFCALSWRLI